MEFYICFAVNAAELVIDLIIDLAHLLTKLFLVLDKVSLSRVAPSVGVPVSAILGFGFPLGSIIYPSDEMLTQPGV